MEITENHVIQLGQVLNRCIQKGVKFEDFSKIEIEGDGVSLFIKGKVIPDHIHDILVKIGFEDCNCDDSSPMEMDDITIFPDCKTY